MDLRNIHLQQKKQHSHGFSLTQQLFLALREKILSQQLLVGSRLPASRILAKDLGVSRNTVNSVYEQLRAEGYVNSREGSGFYISEQLPQLDRCPHIAKGKPVQDWPPLSDYGHQLLKRSAGHGSKPNDIANLPFSVGLPDFQAFPIKIWQQLIRRHSDRPILMGYHSHQGYAPLRNALADYLNISRGLKCRPEQIVITQGAQQGLALCAQLLMNSGDTALVEEPGYSGARKALMSNGASLQAVTHGDNGINVGALPEGEYRLLCCTPTHQYPMGGILTASERLQLLQWAERNRCWIVEDDYDSEFHYYSQPIAAMAGMAERTPVIYMGSFSKTLLPGLRLGYLMVPEHLVGVFVEAKAFSGGETPLLTQAVVADFIEEGHFYRHLRRSRKLYQQKWEHMQCLCEKHLAGIMTPVAQSAGMHLALVFNHQQIDDRKVCQEFAMKGFGGSPLSSYYHSSRPQKGLVLGFANTSESERLEGMKVLSELSSFFERC